MKKITFNTIQKWIKASQKPLNKTLETFQEEYFGKDHHQYYRVFYHMIKELKPAVALEIGIDHGHTLAHMAAGNPGTLVVGIDKRENCAQNMPTYPNVRLIYGDSLDIETEYAVRNIVHRHGGIGVIFQDSSHHYEASHREFDIYSKFLTSNGIWCCDDVMDIFHDPLIDPPGKSMATYFDELPGQKKLYPGVHYGSVIGVILNE